jgi:hypothetical protein
MNVASPSWQSSPVIRHCRFLSHWLEIALSPTMLTKVATLRFDKSLPASIHTKLELALLLTHLRN